MDTHMIPLIVALVTLIAAYIAYKKLQLDKKKFELDKKEFVIKNRPFSLERKIIELEKASIVSNVKKREKDQEVCTEAYKMFQEIDRLLQKKNGNDQDSEDLQEKLNTLIVHLKTYFSCIFIRNSEADCLIKMLEKRFDQIRNSIDISHNISWATWKSNDKDMYIADIINKLKDIKGWT